MHKFFKALGVGVCLGFLPLSLTAMQYYGATGFDFGDEMIPIAAHLVDIDGDNIEEVIAMSYGEDSSGSREGMFLWAFEWDSAAGKFKVLDTLFLGEGFIEGFISGELASTLPGDEIVFTMQEDERTGNVHIIGWSNGFSSMYRSENLLQDEQGFIRLPVVSDIDGDGANEIAVCITKIDSANCEQTGDNIDEMSDNPIVEPLLHNMLAIIDNLTVSYHILGTGAFYSISSANLDGDSCSDLILAVSDLDYTNVNQFFNQLWDFMEEFETEEDKSLKSACIRSFAPVIKEIKKAMIPSSKIKDGLNFDEIVTRTESSISAPVPQLPDPILNTNIYSFENGTLTLLYSHHGVNLMQLTGNADSDSLDEICIKSIRPGINVINDILTSLNLVKITETWTSKRIDPYTGQPEYSDTSIYPEPKNIPHTLSDLSISGSVFLLDNDGSLMWRDALGALYPWGSWEDTTIVAGGNNFKISNLNALLSDLNNMWVDFRSYLPDSTEWFLPVIPTLPSPLLMGKMCVFTGSGVLWEKQAEGILTTLATSSHGIFNSVLNPNYSDINSYIAQFNTEYGKYYTKWHKWVNDSISPYASTYDSCMQIYNNWALEYYDSLQSGGHLPDEPQIDWPDWPYEEPEFETPDYTGSISDLNLTFYDSNGTPKWNGYKNDVISLSTQNGLTYDLDGDPYPDFIFIRHDLPTPNNDEYNSALYIYSTIPFGIETPTALPSIDISQNVPNPFNRETLIKYSVSKKNQVSIDVYTPAGQLVKKLVNEPKKPGFYAIMWNGKDNNGKTVGSGIYLYKIRIGDYTATRKIVLIK